MLFSPPEPVAQNPLEGGNMKVYVSDHLSPLCLKKGAPALLVAEISEKEFEELLKSADEIVGAFTRFYFAREVEKQFNLSGLYGPRLGLVAGDIVLSVLDPKEFSFEIPKENRYFYGVVGIDDTLRRIDEDVEAELGRGVS